MEDEEVQKASFLEKLIDSQVNDEFPTIELPHVVVIVNNYDGKFPVITVHGPYDNFLLACAAADTQQRELESCGDYDVTYSVTSIRSPEELEVYSGD